MSLKAQAICPVPEETARVARAAYPKGNVSMQMRKVLGSIYTDEDFVDLFPCGRAACLRPVAIGPDYRDAICGEPVRSAGSRCGARAHRLEISAWPGTRPLRDLTPRFSPNARTRLLEHHAEERLLEKMLTIFEQKGW
jgi:hypothetical protein